VGKKLDVDNDAVDSGGAVGARHPSKEKKESDVGDIAMEGHESVALPL